jgi:hypothetical protein
VIEKEQEVKMVSGLKGNTYEEKCAGQGLETLKSKDQKRHGVVSDRQDLFTLASSNNGGARARRAAGEKCLAKQSARTDIRKNDRWLPTMVQLTCLQHLYLGSSTPIIMYPVYLCINTGLSILT